MSDTVDSSHDASVRDSADNDHRITASRSAVTEAADEPPAEPMSREEYADYIRQEPAAGSGDDTGGEYGPENTGEPGDGDDSRRSEPADQGQGMTRSEYADYIHRGPAAGDDNHDTGRAYDAGAGIDQPSDTGYGSRAGDPAEQAEGMSRSEYADYMHQGPAAGDDDPGIPGAGDSDDPSREPDTSYPAGDTGASRVQDPGGAATRLDPTEQPAGAPTYGDRDSRDGAGPGSRLEYPGGTGLDTEPLVRDNGDSGTDKTELPVPAHDDSPQQPPPGQDVHEEAAPPHESEDSWPPPIDDQDRVRKLYGEYLADMAAADSKGGRDQGTSVVGPKPDSSPGEISDLPPSGDKLIEMESSKKSRFNELLREAEKEETLDDLHDAIEEDANTIQKWLSASPPEGHAEQPVPTSSPHIAPWVPEHGIEGGNAATAVMVAGILSIHLVRWINGKLRPHEG